MKNRTFIFCLCCLVLLTSCSSTRSPRYSVESLGTPSYTMSTLDGYFFTYKDMLYLISGTVTRQGSNSQVFIYQVETNKVLFKETLENCVSMTAFCETDTSIFFATYSLTQADGCDLYSWDKESCEMNKLFHFPERGICDLAWDGKNTIYVGTSYSAGLYQYKISENYAEYCCDILTEYPYIRSMSYLDGHVYLGIGSSADLLEVTPETGAVCSILPEEYKGESFVYAQGIYDGNIYFLLSPSYQIIRYDPISHIFEAVECTELNSLAQIQFPIDGFVDLQGILVVFQGDTPVSIVVSENSVVSYIDVTENVFHMLDGSGIYHRNTLYDTFSLDFAEILDKQLIRPINAFVIDSVLYIPWRRFVRQDLRNLQDTRTFLVTDEPQAALPTEQGIFTANYTDCTIYFYSYEDLKKDPSEISMNSPEYLLANIEHQCRPRDLCVVGNGRYLVLGSGPLYGLFGGAVSVYDLQENKLLYTHEHVIENHQIVNVLPSKITPGAVWLGTAPLSENGEVMFLDEPGHIVLWDYLNQRIMLDIVPEVACKDLRATDPAVEYNGVLYVRTRSGDLLCFDALTGKQLAQNIGCEILGLFMTTDGLIGYSSNACYSINMNTLECNLTMDGFTYLHNLTQDPITGILYLWDDVELLKLNPKT